ncbi:MAG: hypothetical protein ACJ762_05805 [Solirubrobacteraceae bacterium]
MTGVAAAAAIALFAGGCGGGDDEQSAVTTVVETVTTTAPETTDTVVTQTTAVPRPESASTPGGTKLEVGDPAVVVYDDTGSSGKKTLVQVTPTEIEKGSLDDFKNIDLDADQKASTPYYVKVTAKNVGEHDISGADPASYINGVDDRGQDQNEIIFFGDFERCAHADPKSFKPGDEYETCLTYLIPGGGSIEGLRWIFFDEENSKSNIDWK